MTTIEPWLIDLAKETGTPHFVIDLHVVRMQIHRFQELFPNVMMFYSTKTNSAPAVIDTCLHSGMQFDAATLKEIEYITGRGAHPSSILYTHPVKTPQEIKSAHKLGVTKYTFDSVEELEKLQQHAPQGQYFLRLVPHKNKSMYNYRQRLGANSREAHHILGHAASENIPVTGLSFHVGSQSMKVDPWIKAIRQCRDIIKRYYERIPALRKINMGSGFPVDYGFGKPPSLESIAAQLTKEMALFPADVRFMAEPGRVLVAPSGFLITSVIDRVKRGKTEWLFTDATVYSGLIERIESDGRFKYPVSSPHRGHNLIPFSIAGKTLDPDDIIGEHILLDSSMSAGDLLIIHNVGAYTLEFFTTYHALPAPFVTYYDSEHADKVEVSRSVVAEKGLRAKRHVSPGETLFTISGHRSKSRSRTSFQIDENLHLEPTIFGAYLNHSCSPNAGIRTNGGGTLNLIAKTPIEPGEEVTVDYAMFEYELADMSKIPCQCRTLECRGSIQGYRYLPEVKKAEYFPYTANHLIHKRTNSSS